MNRRATELRVLRIGLRIPQYELAMAAGIDPSRLSKIERGLCEPDASELARLFQALGPGAELGLTAAEQFLRTIDQHRLEPETMQQESDGAIE